MVNTANSKRKDFIDPKLKYDNCLLPSCCQPSFSTNAETACVPCENDRMAFRPPRLLSHQRSNGFLWMINGILR